MDQPVSSLSEFTSIIISLLNGFMVDSVLNRYPDKRQHYDSLLVIQASIVARTTLRDRGSKSSHPPPNITSTTNTKAHIPD